MRHHHWNSRLAFCIIFSLLFHLRGIANKNSSVNIVDAWGASYGGGQFCRAQRNRLCFFPERCKLQKVNTRGVCRCQGIEWYFWWFSRWMPFLRITKFSGNRSIFRRCQGRSWYFSLSLHQIIFLTFLPHCSFETTTRNTNWRMRERTVPGYASFSGNKLTGIGVIMKFLW